MAKQITSALLLATVFSCDDEKKPHEALPTSPSAVASVLGIDAAALGIGLTDPERPAGDLATDLNTFTTVEACMKQRTASLDPLVGDAVDAIGYDTFLRDACRVLEAAKNQDLKRCELIDASALRARCRALTAMVIKDPDSCPMRAPSKPELGRDAICVAAASRSIALCAGATPRDRPACEALLAHDTTKCDALVLPDQRSPCVRDARRFRDVLVGPPALAEVPAAKGTLTLHGDGRPDPAQTTIDIGPDVASGVVVVLDGKRSRLSIGRIDDAGTHAVQPLERTRFAITLAQSDDKPAEIAEATLSVSGAARSSCSSDACAKLTAKVTRSAAKRGGSVDIVVDGTLGGFRLHADITTFIRDVVDRAAWR